MSTDLVSQKPSFSLAPKDLDEALRFADILSKSNIIPKDFSGNPGNILVAIQWGMELGLQPMQAMQNIAVINGRPSLWGDAVIGLVKSSPLCEFVVEEIEEESATCRVKRRGEPEQSRTFSLSDAKKAGLIGKQGPWTQYTKRMMQMRARSWALRDVFPDVLRGMPVAEELMDMGEKEINPAPKIPQPPTPTAYPDDNFSRNFPQWEKLIQDGKKTGAQIISTVSAKGILTEEQKSAILAVAVPVSDAQLMASPDQMREVRQAAESATISWHEVCQFLGVELDSILTAAEVPAALKFISNPMGA